MPAPADHTASASLRLGEADLWDAYAEGVGPRDRKTPFRFGCEDRVYTKEGRSARWRSEETPWAEEPLWALSDESPFRRIVCPKGTQLGFTEIGLIAVGAGIGADESWLIIEPTEAVAKRVVKTKFRPMLRTTSSLAGVFTGRAADTTLHFSSETVDVIFAGSNSPTNFATITVPRAMGDEVDRWSPELLKEGDPVDLLENRIAEYGFLGKLFLPSSPTVEGASIVWREWLQSDQRVFECPCPRCGVLQEWRWENIDLDTAQLRCTACEELSAEVDWKTAWSGGAWRATCAAPVRSDTIGFHLSTLYARLGQRSWAQLVQQYHAAQASGLSARMQVFWNTILGLPWKVTEDAVPVQELRQRLEAQEQGVVPAGGLVLTAGCDYQKNRIEAWIWAWARGRERWLVERVEVPRLTRDGAQRSSVDLAEDLNRLALERDWPHEQGGVLRVEFSVHDSGDHPADVFDVLEHLSPGRNCASKGVEGWGQQMLFKPPKITDVRRDGKVVAHGRRLMIVNTAPAKQAWYDDLRRAAAEDGLSERFVHLPEWLDEQEGLLEQLVAEEVRKTSRGRLKWVKIHDRNEGLDCAILADAGRWQLKTHRFAESDWKRREALVAVESEEARKKRERSERDAQVTEGAAKARAAGLRAEPKQPSWLNRSSGGWL